MQRKAQTATEYMIILAVVIIIALIVVGVMGGIPGIGTGARSRASASYWNTADIAITSYAVTAAATAEAGSGTMRVRNNRDSPITITEVFISTTGSATPSVEANTTQGADIVLGVGTEKDIVFSDELPICLNKEVGDAWTANIRIEYVDDATGARYNFTGEGNKLEGICAT